MREGRQRGERTESSKETKSQRNKTNQRNVWGGKKTAMHMKDSNMKKVDILHVIVVMTRAVILMEFWMKIYDQPIDRGNRNDR